MGMIHYLQEEGLMSKARMITVFLSVVMLVLTGCLSSMTMGGAFSPDKVPADLIPGQTTKEEVRKMYGEPTSSSQHRGEETWVYVHKPSKVGNTLAEIAQTTRMTALGQATAHAGIAGGEAGGLIGGAVASSATNSVGRAATDAVTPDVEYGTKTLTVFFTKQGIVRDFSLQ